ncbi:RES domain-containing protein [Flavisphingomonas formosensis]|uniref:RES domain-containing protein n=1 Tax=Flavisphingomonas formosensis TaxID=861534 RepID=UPI0018E01BE3|nr:RES domain-containing protein [Sphingomonas formosensis]
MTLDEAILRGLAVSIDVTGYLRIFDAVRRAMPTGIGYGRTRFASPTDSFRLLYAAQDLQTALAEAVIRDRYQGRQKRQLLEEEIEQSVIASLRSRAPLTLPDLRTSGASRLGGCRPTWCAAGHSNPAAGSASNYMTARISTASSTCRGSRMPRAWRPMIER